MLAIYCCLVVDLVFDCVESGLYVLVCLPPIFVGLLVLLRVWVFGYFSFSICLFCWGVTPIGLGLVSVLLFDCLRLVLLLCLLACIVVILLETYLLLFCLIVCLIDLVIVGCVCRS